MLESVSKRLRQQWAVLAARQGDPEYPADGTLLARQRRLHIELEQAETREAAESLGLRPRATSFGSTLHRPAIVVRRDIRMVEREIDEIQRRIKEIDRIISQGGQVDEDSLALPKPSVEVKAATAPPVKPVVSPVPAPLPKPLAASKISAVRTMARPKVKAKVTSQSRKSAARMKSPSRRKKVPR